MVVSKKSKKKNFFFSLFGKNGHGIREMVAIFHWEWGRNTAPRDGQKIPSNAYMYTVLKVEFVGHSSELL